MDKNISGFEVTFYANILMIKTEQPPVPPYALKQWMYFSLCLLYHYISWQSLYVDPPTEHGVMP